MKIHNLEQQTPEWFELRKFKFTASKAHTIKTNGKGLETYALELASEGFSVAEKEHFSNIHTARGNELEPQARAIYELETGNEVEEVGFCEHSKYIGCSPDGFVGEDGGVEIKCIDDKNYFLKLIEGDNFKIDNNHHGQMQMCMMITGRKWWDYIIFNPNFKKSILIKRVELDEKYIEDLKKGLENGVKILKGYIEKYNNLIN